MIMTIYNQKLSMEQSRMTKFSVQIIFLLLISISLEGIAQNIYVSKYIFGNFIKDDNHYIEIFNESNQTLQIGGYLLVTRYYVLRLPEPTKIAPYSALRLAKTSTSTRPLDIQYVNIKDFLVRFPSSKDEGDYILILDRNRNILDASYFSQMGRTRFLPDRGELITAKGEAISYEIPSVNYPKWQSMDIILDPAMALVRLGGKWQITSKKKNLLPATEYANFQANYVDGIVTVKWQTLFETDCFQHILERSLDGEKFTAITQIEAKRQANKASDYLYYDQHIQKEKHYFYRVKNIDKFQNEVYSAVIEASTSAMSGDVNLQIIDKTEANSQGVLIRFACRTAQHISVKLMDEQFQELGVLFDAAVSLNSENLIRYEKSLPLGKYYIIAETKERRYYKEFIIKN